MGKITDITGERFGRLKAVRFAYLDSENKAIWECLCDCGNTFYVSGKRLRSGNTISCGCAKSERARMLKYKDGRCKDRLHMIWQGMIRRCEDRKNRVYHHYGGRGIGVCAEWHEYAAFKTWAYENGYDENAPRGKCTIDRIDNDGNYCPENCRWVDMVVQRNNSRPCSLPDRDPVSGRFVSKT